MQTEKQVSKLNWKGSLPFLFLLILIGCSTPTENKLEYLGPPVPQENGDTTMHAIGPFTFVNQNGHPIGLKDYEGKIWVADVFFTSCPGICPKLSQGMAQVQEAFRDDPEVMLLSITVDPEVDSVKVLREYADQYQAIDGKWNLVTGEKQTLYQFANGQFFFKAFEGEGGELGFIHDEAFRLIDKEGHLRGSWHYNGTDEAAVDSLINDIKKLKREYSQGE